MKESQFASLETMLDEVKARCSASPVRTKHLNYFLEGLRSDAKKMIDYSNSAQWLSIQYSMMPTFLLPFEASIKEKLAGHLGNAFASAKCLYDNLNRFLQAAYLPEKEIVERDEKIANSSADPSTSWGKAYELSKFDQISASGEVNLKNLVSSMKEINEGNELTRVIRNAAMHGHGHVLVDKDKKGFFISEDFSKGVGGISGKLYAEEVLEGLSHFYLGIANKYIQEFTEQSKNLRPSTKKDRFKMKTKNIGYSAIEFSKLYAKYMIAPLTAVTIGLVAIDSIFDHNQIATKQHKDEQSIRQLKELVEFQNEGRRLTRQAEDFVDQVNYLDRESMVLMSYTNRPRGFDYDEVSNTLARLKRIARASEE